MGVADGGKDGVMAEDFLNVENADARFNQMRGTKSLICNELF